MDFFEHQKQARRRTGWLILAFVFALFFVGFCFYVPIISIAYAVGVSEKQITGHWLDFVLSETGFYCFLWTQGICSLIIVLGSWYKIHQLSSGGGETVAELLGGREISPFTRRFEERQLMNIVEEMAIAAGIIVPAVYVLEKERRINAFSAGFDPDSAVIGVTYGALNYLDREELQGIVAHEFSHILNGDMKLNMRMIGVLFGLGMVTQLGIGLISPPESALSDEETLEFRSAGVFFLLPAGWFTGIFYLTIAISLMILGFFGWFFGALIKSAISRQREYLADAAAVQFTRNPRGIKNALRKIGCPRVGSLVYSAHALEASHLFIARIYDKYTWEFPWLSSHPSPLRRILRIDPNFDGTFPPSLKRLKLLGAEAEAKVPIPTTAYIDELLAATNPRAGRFLARQRYGESTPFTPIGSEPVEDETQIAEPVEPVEEPEMSPLDAIPLKLVDFLLTPGGIAGLMLGLLCSGDPAKRTAQRETVASKLTPEMRTAFEGTADYIGSFFKKNEPLASLIRLRCRILELAASRLDNLSGDQYRVFRDAITFFCGELGKVDLYRYTLAAIARYRLDVRYKFAEIPERKIVYTGTAAIREPLQAALSYLAYSGHTTLRDAETAFSDGMKTLNLTGEIVPVAECSFRALDEAFKRIRLSAPPIRKRCLQAFHACICSDGMVTAKEEQFLLAAEAMLGG